MYHVIFVLGFHLYWFRTEQHAKVNFAILRCAILSWDLSRRTRTRCSIPTLSHSSESTFPSPWHCGLCHQVPPLCAAADQEETTRKEGEDPVSERRPEERQVPEHAPQQGEQRWNKARRLRSGFSHPACHSHPLLPTLSPILSPSWSLCPNSGLNPLSLSLSTGW